MRASEGVDGRGWQRKGGRGRVNMGDRCGAEAMPQEMIPRQAASPSCNAALIYTAVDPSSGIPGARGESSAPRNRTKSCLFPLSPLTGPLGRVHAPLTAAACGPHIGVGQRPKHASGQQRCVRAHGGGRARTGCDINILQCWFGTCRVGAAGAGGVGGLPAEAGARRPGW